MDQGGPITAEALKRCHQQRTVHMKLTKGGGLFGYRCVEHPRLTWSDSRSTGRDRFKRTMMVDDLVVANLAEAAAALNRTPEENARMADQLNLEGGAGEKKWT